MRFCPFCAKENRDEAGRCAHCGKRLPERRQPPRRPPQRRREQSDPGAITATPTPLPAAPASWGEPSGPDLLDAGFEGSERTRPETMAAITRVDRSRDYDDSATVPTPLLDPLELGLGIPDPLAGAMGDVTVRVPLPEGLSDDTPEPLPPPPGAYDQDEPTAAGVAIVAAELGVDALPPMPRRPRAPGLAGAVSYLVDVTRGWVARRRLAGRIRDRLPDGQGEIDEELRQLGAQAAAEHVDHPALRREMATLDDLAAQRERLTTEAQKLREGRPEQQKRLARQIAAAETQVTQARKAAQAIALGVPNTDSDHTELVRLQPGRGRAEATAAAKQEAEREVGRRRRELGRLEDERDRLLGELDRQLAGLEEQRAQLEAAIAQQHATVGTLLNLNRVEGEQLSPHYGRIDELKARLGEREALIARLDRERGTFDRSAFQTGLAVVVGSALLIIALVAALVAVLG